MKDASSHKLLLMPNYDYTETAFFAFITIL